MVASIDGNLLAMMPGWNPQVHRLTAGRRATPPFVACLEHLVGQGGLNGSLWSDLAGLFVAAMLVRPRTSICRGILSASMRKWGHTIGEEYCFFMSFVSGSS